MKKISRAVLGSLTAFLMLLQPAAYAKVNNKVRAHILAKKVQSFTESFVQGNPVRSIIYGIWVNGFPISVSAMGESMTNVPATTNLHFRIGGVTQTMLTTLLMQLVERGVVSLDDRVARWFPTLPNADLVSLQMLANGTSGYPDYIFNDLFQQVSTILPYKEWTTLELLDYAFMAPPLFPPNTSQHYSHTDSVILGSILSQATNTPFDQLLYLMVLNPLGLGETRFSLAARMPLPVLNSYSSVRNIYEDSTFWNPSWVSYSGSMFSTIYDLGKWANAWILGSLISPTSTQILRAPFTVGKGNNTATLYFAMGFVYANHWLFQNPSFGGYSGIFAVLPEKNMVFIAFNTINSGDDSNINWSAALWKQLAKELAPEYPLPPF